MTSPNSPSCSSPPALSEPVGPCQICGKRGHGNHFGAITCRACAAFFRRFGISSGFSLCRRENKCVAAKNGWFGCKQCRLQKCWDNGMTIDNFQFQRDPFHRDKRKILVHRKIPQSSNTFLRKPNLILYTTNESSGPRNFIDVRFLVEKAVGIMEKIIMLKGIWVVWSRLDKMASAAVARRENVCDGSQLVYEFEGKQMIMDPKTVDFDLSWCSRYSFEQLKLPTNLDRMDFLIQPILDLSPTDVELSFMMCQLCFSHVGRRFQEEILKVSESFLEHLSDNLHEYYTKQNKTFYSVRIAHMMRINNLIREEMQKRRNKLEMMRFFNVFNVDHSDPEMFVDF
uniref:Nuclear receptor domain-containing protein n=1 Tax=Caenorhabditis tropicalis TaxID=1561998 RepID=A0A1I7T1N1_9PELO